MTQHAFWVLSGSDGPLLNFPLRRKSAFTNITAAMQVALDGDFIKDEHGCRWRKVSDNTLSIVFCPAVASQRATVCDCLELE